jgi:hypothetical protein
MEWSGALLARRAPTVKGIGRTPTLVLCSRNARPEKGLVRRAHLDQHGCPSKRGEASKLGRINQPPSLRDNERAWREHLFRSTLAVLDGLFLVAQHPFCREFWRLRGFVSKGKSGSRWGDPFLGSPCCFPSRLLRPDFAEFPAFPMVNFPCSDFKWVSTVFSAHRPLTAGLSGASMHASDLSPLLGRIYSFFKTVT